MAMKCYTAEARNFEKALNDSRITFNQFQELQKIWHELSPGGQAEVSDMLTVNTTKTGDYGNQNLYFRGEKVSYGWAWDDADTFGFDFGDGDFTDSEGDEYFIRLEYHVADDEWIVEIWWEDVNVINVNEVSFADDYITKDEIEKVKEFAKQFMKEEE